MYLQEKKKTFQEISLTSLRAFAGALFMTDAFVRLFQYETFLAKYEILEVPFASSFLSFAIGAELLGGLGLLVGLLTPVAAAAVVLANLGQLVWVQLPESLSTGQLELSSPIIALLVSLLFVAFGGGRWSFDRWLKIGIRGARQKTKEKKMKQPTSNTQHETGGKEVEIPGITFSQPERPKKMKPTSTSKPPRKQNDKVTEAGKESFPASDPPSYSPGRA